ncbi:MAG: M13 family peptidase [Pedobacter sp.]|nr:MAG: M13 family peptidase [Pedobacter sp.]
MNVKFFAGAVGLSLLALTSCSDQEKTLAATRTEFFDKTGIDSTVNPGDDFFMYANGNWMKTTVIPDDQSGWGSFYTLYESNLKNLHEILQESAKANAAKGTLEQKVGDFYASGMDTIAIEKVGVEPLKPMLAKIDSVKDYKELMNLLAGGYANGDGDLMGFYVNADEKNSTQNIAIFFQSGLNLPEKEYYTKQDSATQAARKAFTDYATKLFSLTGSDTATAAKNAATILALETEIAKSHRTPAETRDPQKNYNKTSVGDLQKQQPNINWQAFFSKLNVKADSVNIAQPGYFQALNSLLASQPIETWKTKVKYDYIAENASLLTKAFRDAEFEFSKTFSGQKIQSDRWKTIVNQADGGMGELLGQLYVKKHFNDTAKQRMDELVTNLQKAFEARIKKLDWMSDSTKQRSLVKLNAFMKKIGYPSKWKAYDDVTIDRNNYFANAKSVELHARKEMIGKIGNPVDKTEWGMSPPTVNAYYNPSNNEIVFPAGILQFPFFDAAADDAINYGGIGMVIGHEMTHGFDDQGSQYDEKGNMQNWWTAADNAKFKAKTSGVVAQYNAYTLFDSLHVKGDLTLGENIADIGGLAIAYDAFKMTKQGQSNEKIDGFTPDQRFFLGFAQAWRLKNRDETMRMRLNVDPHSPEIFRVNGPLSNFDPFYTAFNVKEGAKLYIKPENRARIW